MFVSSPAERLGLYYSQGILQPALPGIVETFEILVGVDVSKSRNGQIRVDTHRDGNISSFQQTINSDSDSSPGIHDDSHIIQSETSVRIAVDIVADIAQLKREHAQ